MLRTIALTALVVVSTFGVASANHEPPCVAQNAGGQDQPVYFFPSGASVQVWQESNAFPGLQRTACRLVDGQVVAGDTLVTTVSAPSIPRCPIDLGGSPVCIV